MLKTILLQFVPSQTFFCTTNSVFGYQLQTKPHTLIALSAFNRLKCVTYDTYIINKALNIILF